MEMKGVTIMSKSESISRGDRVQQIAAFGLSPLTGLPYVIEATYDKLVLSRGPDGPPITDLQGQPRHYPHLKFRKVTWDT